MGAAARLVHDLAHAHAGGRWLATGGGGYDVYRVVPRAWSLVWLAAAHRDVPARTPDDWRERWAGEAARHGQSPLPLTFDDPPNPTEPPTVRAIEQTLAGVRSTILPLLRAAVARG
jgi:acetoin utilization protein AcuC